MSISPPHGPWWLPVWAEFASGSSLGIDAPRSTIGAMIIAAHGTTYLRSVDDIRREVERLTGVVVAAAASLPNDPGQATESPIAFWNRVCTYGIGLVGDDQTYHDPRNSFLPEIRRRKTGLPIGLALVWLHAAHVLAVDAFGVGMPGHFLVGARHGQHDPVFIDCFNRGTILDAAGCQVLYERVLGGRPHAGFHPSFLAPVPDESMFVRMTANLKQHAARRRDLSTLADLARLRWFLPLPSLEEDRELVRLCVALGSAGEAQHWLAEVEARYGTAYPDTQLAADRAAVRAAFN